MGDARIKRGWGTSMVEAGSGTYRGGTASTPRAGGYGGRKRKVTTAAVRVIKGAELDNIIKEYTNKSAPRKTGGGGGYPINPKLGGRDVGGRKAPWRKRRILE